MTVLVVAEKHVSFRHPWRREQQRLRNALERRCLRRLDMNELRRGAAGRTGPAGDVGLALAAYRRINGDQPGREIAGIKRVIAKSAIARSHPLDLRDLPNFED